MPTKRKFVRVRCRIKSSLEHKGRLVNGHVENLSVSGALLRLHESILARPGEMCRLSLYLCDEKAPLRIRTELIHVGFSLAGLRFLDMDEQAKMVLLEFLCSIGHDPGLIQTPAGVMSCEEMVC